MEALPQDVIDALISEVRAAARAEILPRFRNLAPGAIATKTGPMDLVTDADKAVEGLLSDAAARLLPQALVVGEEAVSDTPSLLDDLAGADWAVIIDPVDGTGNFASGLAVFGVILAVVHQGRTVFGLLYDPLLDDWVMAMRGGGAWFCKPGAAPQRLRGAAPKPLDVLTAFVPLSLYPQGARARVAARLPEFGRVTSLRCSCHEYRLMATGHAEVNISPQVKPWDHAAGVLVVEECGGVAFSDAQPGYAPGNPRAPLLVMGHPDMADGGATLRRL